MIGILISHISNQNQFNIICAYPQDFLNNIDITPDSIMDIIETHRVKSDKPNFLQTTLNQIQIMSYYTGMDPKICKGAPDYYITLFSKIGTNLKADQTWESLLETLALDLLPTYQYLLEDSSQDYLEKQSEAEISFREIVEEEFHKIKKSIHNREEKQGFKKNAVKMPKNNEKNLIQLDEEDVDNAELEDQQISKINAESKQNASNYLKQDVSASNKKAKAKDNHMENLVKQIEVLTQKLKDANTKNNEIFQELVDKTKNAEQKQAKIIQLEKELDKTASKSHDFITELEDKIQNLEDDNTNLRDQLKKEMQKFTQLENSVDIRTQRLRRLEKTIKQDKQKAKDTIQKLTDRVETLEHSNNHLKKQIIEMKKKNQILKKDVINYQELLGLKEEE